MNHHDNGCEQCGCGWEDFEMVILPYSTWKSIASKEDTICHECIEQRLGRKITAEDFPKDPVECYEGQFESMREIRCNIDFFDFYSIKFEGEE